MVSKRVRCYAPPQYATLEPVAVTFHPDITTKLFSLIDLCRETLDIACYVIDEYYATALQRVMREPRQVELRMIVDEGKLTSGSIAGLRALLSLVEWGASVKSRHPPEGKGFASAQHEKCWLFDKAVYVCGSHNLTHNSAANCEEAIMTTTERECVDSFSEHFEHLWETGKSLTQGMLGAMVHDKDTTATAKKAARSASRSLPRGSDWESADAPSPAVV